MTAAVRGGSTTGDERCDGERNRLRWSGCVVETRTAGRCHHHQLSRVRMPQPTQHPRSLSAKQGEMQRAQHIPVIPRIPLIPPHYYWVNFSASSSPFFCLASSSHEGQWPWWRCSLGNCAHHLLIVQASLICATASSQHNRDGFSPFTAASAVARCGQLTPPAASAAALSTDADATPLVSLLCATQPCSVGPCSRRRPSTASRGRTASHGQQPPQLPTAAPTTAALPHS